MTSHNSDTSSFQQAQLHSDTTCCGPKQVKKSPGPNNWPQNNNILSSRSNLGLSWTGFLIPNLEIARLHISLWRSSDADEAIRKIGRSLSRQHSSRWVEGKGTMQWYVRDLEVMGRSSSRPLLAFSDMRNVGVSQKVVHRTLNCSRVTIPRSLGQFLSISGIKIFLRFYVP